MQYHLFFISRPTKKRRSSSECCTQRDKKESMLADSLGEDTQIRMNNVIVVTVKALFMTI